MSDLFYNMLCTSYHMTKMVYKIEDANISRNIRESSRILKDLNGSGIAYVEIGEEKRAD